MESTKNGTDDLICKAEINTAIENKHMDASGGGGSGMNWETGIDMHILLILCMKR